MLGRRRQSIHGGFGQLSPQKSSGPFTRNTGTSHGRPGISPRPSTNNLAESSQLSSLAESPESPKSPKTPKTAAPKDDREATNGVVHPTEGSSDLVPVRSTSSTVNGTAETDVLDVPPPPGPPPPKAAEAMEPTKDAEGFTIPGAMNDPISQAQREAAASEESDQVFKLNIQSSPVEQEDPDAKKAAFSNVANTLTQMGLPSRKAGTIRGRRDVRNTIYVPPPNVPEGSSENPFPPSPALPSIASKPAAVAALVSEASIAGTSDSQSIRSANSLGSLVHVKHPEMLEPGLNSSIIETVSATFEDGVIKSAKVSGEIAFSYNFSASAGFDSRS
jgi:F-BAR domain only protein